MSPNLFIKSFLILILLNCAAISGAQAQSLEYSSGLLDSTLVLPFNLTGSFDTASMPTQCAPNNQGSITRKWLGTPTSCSDTPSLGGSFSAFSTDHVDQQTQNAGQSAKKSSDVSRLNAVPLSAAAWLFSSALLGFILIANRRRV